jgi:hypothetical protein
MSDTKDDGVIASAPVVPGRTLAELESAIVAKLDELADLVPDGGEENAEARAKREVIEMQLADLFSREAYKVDAIAQVLKRLEFTATACKAEAEFQRTRAKSFEGKHARLVGYILDVMLRWGAKKLEGTHATLTRIQNAATVEVDDDRTLPFAYQRWSFVIEPSTPEERDELLALLARMQGRYSVSADKVGLREVIAVAEKCNEAMLVAGAPKLEPPVVPPGVRMRPGSWRLAIR